MTHTNFRIPLWYILVGFLSAGYAQSGVGVSPPRIELQANPGSTLTQEVVVDNPGASATLAVTTTPTDVLLQPSGDAVYLPAASQPNSLGNWLSITPLAFDLEARAAETVRYSVQVPANAVDGTYWGILFFESGPVGGDTVTEGIGITSRVRVGHVIYVDVGNVTRQGEITGVRFEESTEGNRVLVNFQNTGNGVVRPQGQVEVRNTAGELVQTLAVAETASFPGYALEVAAPLSEPLPPGDYVALAVLDYGEASVAAGEGSFQIP